MSKRGLNMKVGGKATRDYTHLDLIRWGVQGGGFGPGQNLRVQRDDLPMDVFYRVLKRDP